MRCLPNHSIIPSSQQGGGGGKYDKKLVGHDKDREITHQLPSCAKQTEVGEINLVYC